MPESVSIAFPSGQTRRLDRGSAEHIAQGLTVAFAHIDARLDDASVDTYVDYGQPRPAGVVTSVTHSRRLGIVVHFGTGSSDSLNDEREPLTEGQAVDLGNKLRDFGRAESAKGEA